MEDMLWKPPEGVVAYFLSQRVSRRVHSNKTDSSIQHESPLGRMKGRLRTLPTWLYLTRYEQVLVGGMRDVSR